MSEPQNTTIADDTKRPDPAPPPPAPSSSSSNHQHRAKIIACCRASDRIPTKERPNSNNTSSSGDSIFFCRTEDPNSIEALRCTTPSNDDDDDKKGGQQGTVRSTVFTFDAVYGARNLCTKKGEGEGGDVDDRKGPPVVCYNDYPLATTSSPPAASSFSVSTEEIFNKEVRPLLSQALPSGTNVTGRRNLTILSYGQQSALYTFGHGKRDLLFYRAPPSSSSSSSATTSSEPQQQPKGLVGRTLDDLFSNVIPKSSDSTAAAMRIRMSYVELSCSREYDLFHADDAKPDLAIRERRCTAPDGSTSSLFYLQGMQFVDAGANTEECLSKIQRADERRIASTMGMCGTTQPRGAVILTLYIQPEVADGSSAPPPDPYAFDTTDCTMITFVDLPGCERPRHAMHMSGSELQHTMASGQQLISLGTVLSTLSKNPTGHIPYRNNQLTRLLKHSIECKPGNASLLIGVINTPAPGTTDEEDRVNRESLSALLFLRQVIG